MQVTYSIIKHPLAQLTINGEVWKEVDARICGKKNPIDSKYPSFDAAEEAFFTFEKKRGFSYACWHLSRRSMPVSQMCRLLEERKISQRASIEVVDQCLKAGFLNDGEWIDRLIERECRKQRSPIDIFSKLSRKGFFEKDLTEPQLAKIKSAASAEALLILLRKKWKPEAFNDLKVRQKGVAYLMRRGFKYDLILNTILSFVK